MAKLTDETRASLRRRSRLVNLGRDAEFSQGFINVPPFRGSTVLYPDVATLKSRDAALHLRHPRHAHDRGPVLRLDRSFGRGGNGARALRARGDRRRADDGAERRRSHADDRFRLSARARLRRHDSEADGDRDHLLRSDDRRRHRRADAAEHQGRVHRVAGLGDPRGAGHSRDRGGRARARRLRHHGQHLGDAALFLAPRAWRRHGGRSRHEISVRPRRPAARPRLGQCGMVRAASSMRPSHGHSPQPRGRVSRAARPAHAWSCGCERRSVRAWRWRNG